LVGRLSMEGITKGWDCGGYRGLDTACKVFGRVPYQSWHFRQRILTLSRRKRGAKFFWRRDGQHRGSHRDEWSTLSLACRIGRIDPDFVSGRQLWGECGGDQAALAACSFYPIRLHQNGRLPTYLLWTTPMSLLY